MAVERINTTWRWATYFNACAALCLLSSEAGAQSKVTADEAAKLAFACPPAKQNIFLTDAQAAEIKKRSGYEVQTKLVPRYVAACASGPGGAAYVDTHTVRSKTETLMIVIDRENKIRRIEILDFNEPPEYRPKEKWYATFEGSSLNEELNLKKGISPVAGSTLTARATTGADRRALALHAMLNEAGKKAP